MFLSRQVLLALISIVGIVGCDAGVNTRMLVRKATDHDEVNPLSGEDLQWIAFTANQFGLNEFGSAFEYPGIRMYSSPSEKHPVLSLFVFFEERPARIEIVEEYPTRRSSKHRKLVDTLMSGLTRRGFDASIAYQTPDPFPWHWLVLPVLGISAAWILWKCSLRQPRVRKKRGQGASAQAGER